MKNFRKLALILTLILATLLTGTTAFAAETDSGIMPRYTHADNVRFSFSATTDGGEIEAVYYGNSSFARADLNVKVEKRNLLVFWKDVYEWNASSTTQNGRFSYVCPLDGSGKYRATFTLTITGTNGTTDVITETIESKY